MLGDALCSRCNERGCKVASIVKGSPRLLVIVLLRFEMVNGRMKKKDQRVEKSLDGVVLNGVRWKLKAVVVHKGSHMSGHYTALTNVGGKWFRCDDSRVESIGIAQVLMEASGGYLFFYEK